MATPAAIEALIKTEDGIKEIKKRLRPFLHLLASTSSDGANPSLSSATSIHVRAQAQAVVALSMGTLRYIGARLRGLDQGRKADDPLRQELNHMRKVLVEVEKLKSKNDEDCEATAKEKEKQEETIELKTKNIAMDLPKEEKSVTPATATTTFAAVADAIDTVVPIPGSRVGKVVAERLIRAALNDADSSKQQVKQSPQKRSRDIASDNAMGKLNDNKKQKANKKQRKRR
jgi:hypothetical protein